METNVQYIDNNVRHPGDPHQSTITVSVLRYDTIGEFNVDSKAEYTA